MTNRLPFLSNKKTVGIICEGYEEYEYIKRLKELGVWNPIYEIKKINAKGNGNIAAIYQDKYQNNAYDILFVFCDTDRKPYEQYYDIKMKINNIHGNQVASNTVVIFGNPCTLQIIILHWKEIILSSHLKRINAKDIEECTGIKDYKAKKDQIKELVSFITESNYIDMSNRVKNLQKHDNVRGSSNFYTLIQFLSDENDKWIDNINELIDEE